MAGDPKPAEGPDLRAGIPAAGLADGAMVLGHVDEAAVLLARRGDEWFAVDATCTHWGGPLAEGMLVGHTVRCPWHHACFDLRTGEPVRPPALHALGCWTVERTGDRVRVTGKAAGKTREVAPNIGGTRAAPDSVLIVGVGAAGSAAAAMLRRQGYEGSITAVDPDRDAPYDRPNLSKDYNAGSAPAEFLALFGDEFWGENKIELIRGKSVVELDLKARRATLDGGATKSFGALLLATGASPRRLDIPGAGLPHVRSLRSRADCDALIKATTPNARVLVIGSSFIGLEVAAALRQRGATLHVAMREQFPFEHTLGRELGDLIRATHERHGVVFHPGSTPVSITADAVTFSTGETVPADVVVLGVGVVPNVELARKAGLAVDAGVLVNEFLETETPGIYAAGDIAQWRDPASGERRRIEHWIVAQRQGQIAACNILGARTPYASVPFFWTQHFEVGISYVGYSGKWESVEVAGDLGKLDGLVSYRRGGKVVAIAGMGRDRALLEAELALERGETARVEAIAAGVDLSGLPA